MTLRITNTSPAADIEAAIVELRARQKRMPAHWTERRAEIGEEIDDLVTLRLEVAT